MFIQTVVIIGTQFVETIVWNRGICGVLRVQPSAFKKATMAATLSIGLYTSWPKNSSVLIISSTSFTRCVVLMKNARVNLPLINVLRTSPRLDISKCRGVLEELLSLFVDAIRIIFELIFQARANTFAHGAKC
jgi:hypothetical protein